MHADIDRVVSMLSSAQARSASSYLSFVCVCSNASQARSKEGRKRQRGRYFALKHFFQQLLTLLPDSNLLLWLHSKVSDDDFISLRFAISLDTVFSPTSAPVFLFINKVFMCCFFMVAIRTLEPDTFMSQLAVFTSSRLGISDVIEGLSISALSNSLESPRRGPDNLQEVRYCVR
jgi:hypothetical protein